MKQYLPQLYCLTRRSRRALAGLLSGLLLTFFSALPHNCTSTLAASNTEQPQSAEQPLILRTPSRFVEIKPENGILFKENAGQLGHRATLERLFLPENQAHFYTEGKRHALTRQMVVYKLKDKTDGIYNYEELQLTAQVLSAAFEKFDQVPDSIRRDSIALEDVLQHSARTGRSLLLDTRNTDTLALFQYQLIYPLKQDKENLLAEDNMLTSITTILVLVRGHIIGICASSINTEEPLYEDVVWTRDAAEKYMEALMADNKKN